MSRIRSRTISSPRQLRRIIAAILLGLCISVGLAEYCALRTRLHDHTEAVMIREHATDLWRVNDIALIAFGNDPHPDPAPIFSRLDSRVPPPWAGSFVTAARTYPVKLIVVRRGFGLSEECLGYWGGENTMETMIHRRAGWPFACVAGTGWNSNPRFLQSPGPETEQWTNALTAPVWLPLWRASPGDWKSMQQRKFLLEPLPLGLLANAVLYGACMWILSLVPPFLARRLRRSRNRCPACNYDRRGLAESAACPECGPIS